MKVSFNRVPKEVKRSGKAACRCGCVLLLSLAVGTCSGAEPAVSSDGAPAAATLSVKMDQAWSVAWVRFYSPKTDLFYDYLSSYEPGKELAHLPTADEVSRQYPNPYGYGTGMEDCMISAGVMLSMVIDRYAVTHDASLKADALKIFNGIKLCATVHGVPGFIARGVCPGNASGVYINSSRDQYTHCVYSLWEYYHSPLCDAATQSAIRNILKEIADRMTRNVTPANNYDFLRADGTRDPRGICRMLEVQAHEAARLPMFYAAAWDVGRDGEHYRLYRKFLGPAVEQSFQLQRSTPTYALLQMQCSLDLLCRLETDSALKARLRQAMLLVAQHAAARAVSAGSAGQKLDLTMIGPDWRQSGGLVGDYRKVWYCIRESGEAALTQLLVNEPPLPDPQRALLAQSITRLDYERVSSSGILYLLAAYWKASGLGIFTHPQPLLKP